MVGGEIVIEPLNGIVHWHRDDQFIWSRKNRLFLADMRGNLQITSTKIEVSPSTRLKWSTNITRRLFRLDIKEIIELGDGLLGVSALGSFYHLELSTFELTKTCDFDGKGPLKLGFDGTRLIYGEYSMNRDRQPIPVYMSEDFGFTWKEILVLNDVRHVHGVFHDDHQNRHWMTSGDLDEESHLRYSDDLFSTFETVQTGDQLFRAIDMIFLPDRILYGTDTPWAKNYICELGRECHNVKKLQQVAGSIFFLRQTLAGFFCTTAVEPSDTNLDPFCEVWYSCDGSSWELVLTIDDDMLHATYFQLGRIQIPSGPGCRNGTWLSPLAIKKDGTSFFIEVPKNSKCVSLNNSSTLSSEPTQVD